MYNLLWETSLPQLSNIKGYALMLGCRETLLIIHTRIEA